MKNHLLLALLVLAGCDLGRYESRQQQAVQRIAGEAQKSALLGAAITIPDKSTTTSTGISLTLPKAVGAAPKAAAGVPGAVDGIVLYYEAEGGGGNGPLALIGGVPAAEGPVDKVVSTITGAFQTIAPGVTPQMSDPKATIKRLSFVGGQTFAGGQSAPGRSDVLVISSASHIAIVIFRAADAADTAKTFSAAVDATITTIQGDAANAAPAGS